MTPEFERGPADYHRRLMIEQMQRDGRSSDPAHATSSHADATAAGQEQ